MTKLLPHILHLSNKLISHAKLIFRLIKKHPDEKQNTQLTFQTSLINNPNEYRPPELFKRPEEPTKNARLESRLFHFGSEGLARISDMILISILTRREVLDQPSN